MEIIVVSFDFDHFSLSGSLLYTSNPREFFRLIC